MSASMLEQILDFNQTFVQNEEYKRFRTNRFPNKKMVILTCMDTRLIELLPQAMNLKNGDAKIIKNAGAIVTQPFGNVMRSIIVALYKLSAREVYVVGHHGCGMTGLNANDVVGEMIERGVSPEVIVTLKHAGIQLDSWLKGFDNVRAGVENSVSIIRNQPLLPAGTPVHGLIIHPETGELEVVTDGYQASS